jgi:amino acid transporter
MDTPSAQARSAPTGTGRLGTFTGVFLPSVLTILGLVLFLRLGYVVGSVGLGVALLVILLANAISVLTSFSLAAIATNLKVKSGGDYYLISRTLGLGYGGAIGIVLFLAQSVSIGFYCVGFGEAATALVGSDSHLLAQALAATAVVALFFPAWMGADWAARFQSVIMALLGAALLSFFVGAWPQADFAHLATSWTPAGPPLPFWAAFAVFFPAVTGFTQGVSMSGDLRDPARSLPLGTFLAVGLSAAVYFAVAVLLAGTQPLDTLAADTRAMERTAAAGWLINVGIFAATLSSALASFVGAPRILQSLARDRVFPLLLPFARGFGAHDNPRRGVILSAAIALAIVALGNLNAIAGVVSMFFLVSYGLLNYATYFEARTASPSFRPTFRWYDPRLSLAGLVACGVAMLAIDLTSALVAVAVLAAIFQYLRLRGLTARWADSSRSHHLQRVRQHLRAASRLTEHPRDWRPYVLAFSDHPQRRARLLQLAAWLEGGSGITTVVRVLEGRGPAMLKARGEAQKALAEELRALDSGALPLVVVAPTLEEAIPVLVQSAGVGPTQANTVLSNWIDAPEGIARAWGSERYGQNLRTAFRLGCNLLVLDAGDEEWRALEALPAADRTIDVWWVEDNTGPLMLLMAYLLTRSDEWRGAKIRVLVPVAPGAAPTTGRLRELLTVARIEAEAIPVENAGAETMAGHSAAASIVFLRFAIREGRFHGPFGGDLDPLLARLPVVVLTLAARDVDLEADPDEGEARERARILDRYQDARKGFQQARAAAEKAEQAVARSSQALMEAAVPGADPAVLARLRTELLEQQAALRKAERDSAELQARRELAAREASERGVSLPEREPQAPPKDAGGPGGG